MAITQQPEDWDEEAIMALYRAYQETRDGIDYRYYRSILTAAKEKSAAVRATTEMEKRISVIAGEAGRLYLSANMVSEDSSEQTTQGFPDRGSNAFKKWKEHFSLQVADFLASISPARLIPVAATLALVAAVTPFFLNTGSQTGSIVNQEIALLQQYQDQAAQEIGRLGGFQHGFSAFNSGAGELGEGYATAFASGVILVDIQSIDVNKNSTQLSSLIDSMSVAPIVKESLQDQSASLSERVISAENALQAHYQNDQFQPVFLLGQWVESAYLLSRVAIINNDSEVMVTALDSLPEVSEMLDKSGYLSPRLQKDFARLEPFRGRRDLSREEVSKASSILLKLRTLEPQVKG